MAENSERHSMTPKYIHKLNLRVNMSYNMRHALNTLFCLLSVSYLVGELICCLHSTVMLTVCYINRQPIFRNKSKKFKYKTAFLKKSINLCGKSMCVFRYFICASNIVESSLHIRIYLRNLPTHTVNNLLQKLNYVKSIQFFVVKQ